MMLVGARVRIFWVLVIFPVFFMKYKYETLIFNFYCFILIAAASANIDGGESGKSRNVKLIFTNFSCC